MIHMDACALSQYSFGCKKQKSDAVNLRPEGFVIMAQGYHRELQCRKYSQSPED